MPDDDAQHGREEHRDSEPQAPAAGPSDGDAAPVKADGSPPTDEPESRLRVPGIALVEVPLLLAIVALALGLRFWGIAWASGYYLHPDELHLSNVLVNIRSPASFREYLNSATSPLNPFNNGTGYIYGTFPLFMAKLVGSFTGYTDISNNHIPGRWISALADTGTVVLVWWIGRMMWNRWIGLLAALLLSLTVLDIQTAHYFTTDAWSSCFATGTFAFVLAAWRHKRWSLYALAGLFAGLAAASKPTMLATAGFLALPMLETVRLYGWSALRPGNMLNPAPPESDGGDEPVEDDDERAPSSPVLLASALSLLVAIWTFRIAQPYTFEGSSIFSFRFDPRWVADVEFWRGVQSGAIDYYPSLQWTERAPIVFQLKNLVLWGMGPALGLAALGGFGWQVWRIATSRIWPSWVVTIPAGWVAFHLVYYGVALSKNQRYLLPAYPLLVVFAAVALVSLFGWEWRSGRLQLGSRAWSFHIPRWCHPGVIAPLVVVLSTALYAFAFVSIYTETNSRAAASEWIVANVPDGSTIANEYWDLGLPVNIPELAGHVYEGVDIEPYADETPDKVSAMVGVLQQSDYVVLSSNRLIDSVSRLPWRYPMANAYYDALFSGELGFEMVGHFTSFPSLFGIEIDDRSAEESLTVYDHPEVYIFRKTDAWNAHDAWYLLDDALGHGGLSIRPAQTQPGRMMLDVDGQEAVRNADSWSSIFDPESIANRFPALAWYLGFQIVTLASVPLAWRLFPWLPDRGYALVKTLGLFLTAWLAWWMASLGIMANGLPVIAISWLAVLGMSFLVARRRPGEAVSDLIRARWWIVATEAIFAASFVVAAWIRSGNPGLLLPGSNGSQLQNMAMFNASVLAPSFPAHDPWLVDGTIHDFTFGYVPWAMLARLIGIAPETAYSLTLATLVALIALNAWLVVSLLLRRLRPSDGDTVTIFGGLAGTIMTIGIGAWGMAQRVGSDDWSLNYEGTALDSVRGLWRTISGNASSPDGAWRITTTWVETGALHFPMFSYLTNELAIHQLGLPLLLAALVPVIGFLGRAVPAHQPDLRPMSTFGGWPEGLPWAVTTGVIAGWTIATNPLFGAAVLLLAAILIFMASAARSPRGGSWAVIRDGFVSTALVCGIAGASIWPFLRMYGTFATERESLAASLDVANYFSLMGASLFIVVAMLTMGASHLIISEMSKHGLPRIAGLLPVTLLVAALGLAWLTGTVALLLLVLVTIVTSLIWRYQHSPPHLIVLGTSLVGLLLSVAATRLQFVSWPQQQNIPLQWMLTSWVLLALVAATMIPWATLSVRDWAQQPGSPLRKALPLLPAAVAAMLVLPAAVYPALGIPDQQDDRLGTQQRTLDAYGFMETAQLGLNALGDAVEPYTLSSDLAAITWMRESLTGLPTILEAPSTTTGGWAGRVSALTGFPAVLGSVPVEIQQRPGMDRLVQWRQADVNAIYGDNVPFAEIEPMLRDYGVQFIYVGPLERATYAPDGLAKFNQAVANGLIQPVYEADGVVIYYFPASRASQEHSG